MTAVGSPPWAQPFWPPPEQFRHTQRSTKAALHPGKPQPGELPHLTPVDGMLQGNDLVRNERVLENHEAETPRAPGVAVVAHKGLRTAGLRGMSWCTDSAFAVGHQMRRRRLPYLVNDPEVAKIGTQPFIRGLPT